MTDDFTGIIKPTAEASRCPFCQETMQSYQTCEIVTAHAMQMLAHVDCVDRAKKDDGRDEDYDEDEECNPNT